jgi:hypothetical protein
VRPCISFLCIVHDLKIVDKDTEFVFMADRRKKEDDPLLSRLPTPKNPLL